MMLTRATCSTVCLAALIAVSGCGDDDDDSTDETGTYAVSIYGEEFVEDEIPASETDGWHIEFSTFEITVSDIQATSEDGSQVEFGGSHTVDLAESSDGEGHLLDELDAPVGLYDSLTYRVAPSADAPALSVEGTATQDDTTKSFAWTFDTDTTYEDCHTSAEVTADERGTSELTIHADHFFYDDLESEEPNVAFDLIASADADDDGEVTLDELAEVDITAESRYQVGSRDIEDLGAFIEAQTATLGHIDGEGHCH